MIRLEFSGMEFAVRKFHRPANPWLLLMMMQSNVPISNIAPNLNCHMLRLQLDYARTFLRKNTQKLKFFK